MNFSCIVFYRFYINVFRCLYVIEYDYLSDFNNLFIYTSVQTKSAFFKDFKQNLKGPAGKV